MSRAAQLRRRDFLRLTGLGLTAGLAVPDGLGRALGAEGFRPPIVVFGKIFQEVKLDLKASAVLAAEAGLDGVDCAVRPGGEILPERAAEEMPLYDAALRSHGLRLSLLTSGITGVNAPYVEAVLRAGRKLGIKYYRLGYWYHRPAQATETLRAEIRARLKDLAALNRELGVCAVFQNHSADKSAAPPAGADLVELYDLLKDLNPDEVGVAFDLGHAILTHGDDWPVHFDRLKDHLRVAYVKDVKRPVGFVPFGQGEFGHTDFFRRVAALGYSAPLSMHVEYEWAPKDGRTRPALLAALRNSRQCLQRWLDLAAGQK